MSDHNSKPSPGAGFAGSEDRDRHFQTDHLLANLKSRTVSSGVITATSQGIQFVLTMGSTMALARLLTPRDFGLVAMVWTVMSFLRVFKEAGLSTATVQREGITHAQVSNLFWVNVAVSGFVTVLVAVGAPVVAWFYGEPRVTGITICLSANFLLAGLAVQHMALLNRQMRFKMIAFIQVGSVLAGVLVGVGMAWMNYGYWSLVWMNLTTTLVALLLTWSVSPWRPKWFTPRSGTRTLLHFGANLTAGSFIYSLARGLDGLLIGRFCGAIPLGLYSRAAAMFSRPLEQFMAPIQAVFIPSFSRLQTQPDRYRQNFIQLYESIALVSFFFTGMFFALARPITMVLLGHKWEHAAPIFAALSFAALQAPLGICSSWVINSQGRGRDSFFASWIISVIVAASYVVGLRFGPLGVAISYSAACLLFQNPFYFWIVGRSGPVRTAHLWVGFFRHLPLWAVVGGTAWAVDKTVQNLPAIVQLAVCVPICFLAGVAFVAIYAPSRCVAANLFSTLRQIKGPAPQIGTEGDFSRESSPVSSAVSVSVIISTYNRATFVVKAVESVLNQTFRDFELIVVDDGSTDGTRSVLEPYVNKIKYVYQNNSGVSATRNAGIALAAGKWIAFLDSDDEWAPNFLERQMQAISQNQDVCMQIADCRYSDQDGEKKSYFETNGTAKEFNGSGYFRPGQPFVFLLRHLSWQIGSVMIRKDIIGKSGTFDLNFSIGEDQDFVARAALHGPVGFLKDKLMTAYRRRELIENLSRIATANPLYSRMLQENVYRKLQFFSGLRRNERRTVKWLRSANYRAIGNLLRMEGKMSEARNAYWTAVIIQPSADSIGKYLLSFLVKSPASRSPMTLDLRQPAED